MRLFGLITLGLVAMAVIAITPVLSQNMKEPTVTKDQSGMGEGIKVHGDWEVKVTDPETGSEKFYAFKNALEGQGPTLLASLLANDGVWDSPNGNKNEYINVWAIQGLAGEMDPKCEVVNLVMEPNEFDLDFVGNPKSVILSGTCTVPEGLTEISRVRTHYLTAVGGSWVFTEKHLPAGDPISVQANQLVSYNVSISFE
jgi:hypothetical protein